LAARSPKQANATGRAEASVAIVLAPAGGTALDVLFIKRAEVDGDPWSGQMAFPGGRREDHDLSLLDTARRETTEEIGVDLPRAALLGVLDDLAPMTPTLPPVLVRPYVFGVETKPDLVPNSEVTQCIWTRLDRLPDQAGVAEISVRGAQLTMPAFLIGPHVVWGMTHRIVSQLLELAL
jgi:8-oxo-dGTP pyrophosphatase MutT (NUDIX family)